MKPSTRHIDLTNIALIVVAAGLAWVFPIQLFIASYVVLGPAHYLTEIGWLHGKQYFGHGAALAASPFGLNWYKRVPWVLVAVTLCLALIRLKDQLPFGPQLDYLLNYQSGLLIGAFIWSVTWVVPLLPSQRLMLLAALLIGGYLLTDWYWPNVFIVLLIPTLIHVFVFTGLFMVQGALVYGTFITWLSLGVFLAAAASFWYMPYSPAQYMETETWRLAWRLTGLGNITAALTTETTDVASRWQGFVAWAYTYHYLNWFSKAEVIKWHRVPRRWLAIMGALWLACVGLYALNLQLGLEVLYGLSLLHVLLEFPLNMVSLRLIGQQVVRRLSIP